MRERFSLGCTVMPVEDPASIACIAQGNGHFRVLHIGGCVFDGQMRLLPVHDQMAPRAVSEWIMPCSNIRCPSYLRDAQKGRAEAGIYLITPPSHRLSTSRQTPKDHPDWVLAQSSPDF